MPISVQQHRSRAILDSILRIVITGGAAFEFDSDGSSFHISLIASDKGPQIDMAGIANYNKVLARRLGLSGMQPMHVIMCKVADIVQGPRKMKLRDDAEFVLACLCEVASTGTECARDNAAFSGLRLCRIKSRFAVKFQDQHIPGCSLGQASPHSCTVHVVKADS